MALIDKASLLMVPSTYEAGKLYNVLPSGNRAPDSTDQNSGYDNTRADFDFDRGSNAAATRIGSDGLIKKYRENLLTFSNDFSNGVWAKSNVSVASSNGAWEITDNTTSGSHYLYWGGTTPASSVLTLSVEAKAGAEDYLAMRLGGFTYAFFNVANGTLGTIHSLFIDAKIEESNDGFYRCSATILTPSSGSASVFYPSDNSSNVSYTGTGAVAITIKNAQLESGLVATDVLTSGATTAKAGVLVDLPRINYDANGNNGALLLEPQRKNIQPFSEYFGSSFWIKTDVSLDFGYLAPDGTNSAYKITKTGSDAHLVNTTTYGNVGNIKSIYAKTTSGTGTILLFNSADTYFTITEDWQRFDLAHDGLDFFYACDFRGTSTLTEVLLWGAQSEGDGLGGSVTYPTSYIPTMGTAQTRAADSCSVTGVSDVIGQTEGTIYFEWDYQNVGSSGGNIPISLAGASGTELYFWVKPDGTYLYDVYNSGQQASIGGSIGSFGIKKIALAYKNNDFALYINGVLIGSDTNGSVPILNRLFIGKYAINSNYNISSGINQATLFNERLTNAELATLTTL